MLSMSVAGLLRKCQAIVQKHEDRTSISAPPRYWLILEMDAGLWWRARNQASCTLWTRTSRAKSFGRSVSGRAFASVLRARWTHRVGRGYRHGFQNSEWSQGSWGITRWTGSGGRRRDVVREFRLFFFGKRSRQCAAGIFR